MVTHSHPAIRARRQRGSLMTDLLFAVSILLIAFFPLALSFLSDQRLARAYYHRALATEIVDGEMEILAAGEWRSYPRGVQAYDPTGTARTNLPPGRFELTVGADSVRLSWTPARRNTGGPVAREVKLP